MSLAASLSHALDGRSSGKGFRVRSICHDGDGKNLYLEDTPDGKLKAACHSHHCEFKTIMQTLEDMGLKPKTEFDPKQRKAFVQKKSKQQLRDALQIETHIALQYLNDRDGDKVKLSNSDYLALHPEFVPLPDELQDRERLAYTRITRIIGQLL